MAHIKWYETLVLGGLLAGCTGSQPADLPPGTYFYGEGHNPNLLKAPRVPSTLFIDGKIQLSMAKGGTNGIFVRRWKQPTTAFSLDIPGLQTASFRVAPIAVKEPSSFMYGTEGTGPGQYADKLIPGAVTNGQHAFFDVHVPQTASTGEYPGHLVVGEMSYPVLVQVHSPTITLREPFVWGFYFPEQIKEVHPGKSQAEYLKLEKVYATLFRAHGGYLASDLPLQEFKARTFLLDENIRYWPVLVPRKDDKAIPQVVAQWRDEFRDRTQTPFFVSVDEPKTAEQFKRIREIGNAVKAAGYPELLHTVTTTPTPKLRPWVDVFIHPKNNGSSHRWTYNGRPPQAGSMTIDSPGVSPMSWGWIAARYNIELWYLWGVIYFRDRHNGAHTPTDFSVTALSFDQRRGNGEDFGNGDGLLIYPGPYPSRRLKAMRRGLLDRQLLLALKQCAPSSPLLKQWVPRALWEAAQHSAWPSEESSVLRLRNATLIALSSCQQ